MLCNPGSSGPAGRSSLGYVLCCVHHLSEGWKGLSGGCGGRGKGQGQVKSGVVQQGWLGEGVVAPPMGGEGVGEGVA